MSTKKTHIILLKRLLSGRNSRPLEALIEKTSSVEIARLFDSITESQLKILFSALLATNKSTLVLLATPTKKAEQVFGQLKIDQQIKIFQNSSPSEIIQISKIVKPESLYSMLTSELPPRKQQTIQKLLKYPEQSAGRLMSADIFQIDENLNVKEATNKLKNWATKNSVYYIYCVNQLSKITGVISLRQLIIAPDEELIKNIISTKNIISISVASSELDIAELFTQYNFVALPVLDEEQKFAGIITIDEVVDLLQEQLTKNIYVQAGLQSDDRIFTPIKRSLKHRLPWMSLNLFLAGIASFVVSLFENTMSELILLASLKNIVAGLGGNTAIQSLTVVTRGLATGDFHFISKWRVLYKEVMVGLSIGVVTGLGAGILTYLWKQNALVGVIIAISMVLNSIVASLLGTSIPIALKSLGKDPAVSSGVVVTTLVDIFSFASFLGIASFALKYFT
ncbi:MAG: magnesium transporter [Bdellovibrionaceae bacterium]|nr:magnesium transporter [Pseudobdellovibrionaceae bacterium]